MLPGCTDRDRGAGHWARRSICWFVFFGLIASALPTRMAAAQEVGERPVLAGPSPRQAVRSCIFDGTDGLPQSTVLALIRDHDGFIWAGTQLGLAWFDGVLWRSEPLTSHPTPVISKLAVGSEGELWVGTAEDGLWRRDRSGWREVGTADGGAISPVEALHVYPGGAWVGIDGGLYRCDSQACTEVEAARGLRVSALAEGLVDGGAVLWIGNAFDGVRRLDLEVEPPTLDAWHLDRDSGLTDPNIRSMILWDDTLWIGSGRGVARLAPPDSPEGQETLIVYGADSGFPRAAVYDFEIGSEENRPQLWAALHGGGLAIFDQDGEWRRLGPEDGLPDAQLYSVLRTTRTDAASDLWVGTANSGVVRRRRGGWRGWTEREGLPHRVVTGIGEVTVDSESLVWVGTLGGAAYLDRGRWRRWLPELLGDAIVYDFLSWRGATWIATNDGLLRWDGVQGRWTTVENSPLPGFAVIDLEALRGETGDELWAATNHGVVRIRSSGQIDAFARNSSFSGLRSFARSESGDAPGSLWLGTSPSVLRPMLQMCASKSRSSPTIARERFATVGSSTVSRTLPATGAPRAGSATPDCRPEVTASGPGVATPTV